MSEHMMETRRRSRSKTPFLRSNCEHESCEHAGEEGHMHHHHTKKKAAVAPNVQTITEETPSSSKIQYVTQTTSTVTTSSQRSKASSPPEKLKQPDLQSKVTSSTNSTAISTKSSKLISNLASSTPKASSMHQSFVAQFAATGGDRKNRMKEVTQNELNTRFERSHRSSVERSNRSNNSTWKSGSVNTQNGDLSDHIAYREYKLAGEYWNKTPKTDYTYSELSPHRRELAPGVVAMPNMSRRGLEMHEDRVYQMIERNPSQEEYIRKRYSTQQHNFVVNRQANERLLFDSGDELDYTSFENYGKKRNLNVYTKQYDQEKQWWLMRMITTIISSVTSVWTSLTGGANDDSKLYRTHYYKQNRGFFGAIKHGFVSLWRYAYLFISSVLYLDTWLLQSKNANSKGRKRFLLLLLLLIPLLLLGAWNLLEDSERQYYLQRSQLLLPISSLANLKLTFFSTGATLQGLLLQVPLILSRTKEQVIKSEPAQVHLHKMELNLQKSGLTTKEYENILNHINSYVRKLVDVKMVQQKEAENLRAKHITPEQTEVFVNIIRENIENVEREKRAAGGDTIKLVSLNDEDLEDLAQRIRMQFELNGWTERPVKLSMENIEEIKRLIVKHIEVNNHEHYNLIVERIVDALLVPLLNAPQLAKFVDARIDAAVSSGRLKVYDGSADGSTKSNTAIEAQQRLIDEVNSEIAFIKLTLADKSSENADLQQSIARLKVSQNDLLARLQQHEFATDERFSGLLLEIQEKISALHEKQFTLLNKQIKLSLIEILSFKETSAGTKLDDVDLKSWVQNVFVAKDYLEERLQAMNLKTNERIKDEIDRSGMILFRDINDVLKKEILLAVEAKHNESSHALKGEIRTALSEKEVQNIVKKVLAIYDADKTGLVDFALESAGGQILSTRCTETYHMKSAQISIFGIPLWYPFNEPRIAISPRVQPGECWAFQGFPGYLVLKLNSLVYVTGFTLEHIPRSLSPNGRIESAPRNFTVWGLEHEKDLEPVLFGEYEYEDTDASLQYFPLKNREINRPFEVVELRIETNHGHPKYTCLYRFRVHGKPPAT